MYRVYRERNHCMMECVDGRTIVLIGGEEC